MAAGGWNWDVAAVIAVMGWLVSPIISLLLPKIFSCLGFDASQKLRELEIHIIPELESTLRAVDQERMMQRGKKSKRDVDVLDKMAAMLRHALEDAEDIFDDAQDKIVSRCWHRLYCAFAACIARFNMSFMWIARIVRSGSARLQQWARNISLSLFLLHRCCHRLYIAVATCIARFKTSCVWIARIAQRGPARLLQWGRRIISLCRFLRRSEDVLPVTTSTAASDEPAPVTTSPAPSNGLVPVATNTTHSDSSGRWLSCWCSLFDFFKNCCRSIFYWLVHATEFARFYRDWSYDMVGITSYQENATLLDIFLTAISRWKLKKRVEKVENTVSEVKKSPLLGVASNNAPNDIANKNKSKIRTASDRKVFGREALRDSVMARLREIPQGDAPSPSTSLCYSVIGIYGVAGSGKTTFAGYIRDYIKEECKELFDTIMCIHVSETFSVEDIFQEMLKDITEASHSNISDHGGLNKKLKEVLRGKRFFLILDDLWVKNKNDQQLEELISPLNVGLKGSKILVTARTKDAAGALCADELIEMPDLDEDQYLMMFMHYALGGKRVVGEEFVPVGRVIAEKLHSSPIAAVTVAGRLGTKDISFWKNTANHETFNETMDALWWSYQQLNPDIRRCFEYCSIFPRRFVLNKERLVRLWIAQGFVKTSCATEDMEDVAEGYIQELVSCSFLQPKGTNFIIHDLLHDLIDKIIESDCFRIENERSQRGEGWKGDVPRDVRHLFVQNYDVELIMEKILGLENLRTLIIYVVKPSTPVEEKVTESICKRLPRLRVLAVAFSESKEHVGIMEPQKFSEHVGIMEPQKFSVPKSIAQLKHLRYLAFRTYMLCSVTLPSALTKLHHIQLLDFYAGQMLEFPFADLVNLRHMFCRPNLKFPNLGRLISLQTLPCFTVSNEQGYEVMQLRDLNKLRGGLVVKGLKNVKSKEEALEANLAAKEGLTCLKLYWPVDDEGTRCNPADEAEVLEGLCPPVGLQELEIHGYRGTRYPDWMVGKQSGGPEGLRNLHLVRCSQLGPGPEFEAFSHLRVLQIWSCSWDSLPGNMEHLTLLKKLEIVGCENIRSLPTLPQSIEELCLVDCNDVLMKSCKTVGHPNWQKIEHIPRKDVGWLSSSDRRRWALLMRFGGTYLRTPRLCIA